MKISDTVRLAFNEGRNGKTEWISSVLMHAVVLVCIFLTLTVSLETGRIFNDYMKQGYPDGYEFYLNGFDENDVSWLENRGFMNIFFSEDGNVSTASIDSIEKIWIYKFQALSGRQDIWNEDIENMLEIVLFINTVFVSIGLVLCVIMVNSSNNSFSMKIDERREYIDMLYRLGASGRDCVSIFAVYFLLRELISLAAAVAVNAVVMHIINIYLTDVIHIDTGFSLFRPEIVGIVAAVSVVIMWISFGKIWRKRNEF